MERIIERCDCGTKTIIVDKIIYNDICCGNYELNIECEYCPKCKSYFLGSKEIEQRKKYIQQHRANILIQKYGDDENNWISLKDVLPQLNITSEYFWKYFSTNFFLLEKESGWYVFKESLNHFIKMKYNCQEATGLFWIG